MKREFLLCVTAFFLSGEQIFRCSLEIQWGWFVGNDGAKLEMNVCCEEWGEIAIKEIIFLLKAFKI